MRASEEIGVKYMQEWEEKYYAKQEARKEGLKEGLLEGLQKGKEERDRELVQKNLKKGRSILEIADLLDESPEYIEKLVKNSH